MLWFADKRRGGAAGPGKWSMTAAEEEAELRAELERLRQDHRDLDAAIAAMAAARSDPISMQRLKKRKLMLKDRIANIEDRLLPDIIA